jgi:hypothetical protein
MAGYVNKTWSGISTQANSYNKAGSYVWPHGSLADPGQNAANQKIIAVQVKGQGVTFDGLTGRHGFRTLSVNNATKFTCRHFDFSQGGIRPSGGKHGGSNILVVDSSNLLFENGTSTDPFGEHAAYFSQTVAGLTIRNCTFRGGLAGSFASLFQLNSESGHGITGVLIEACVFSPNGGVDGLNLLGAGKSNEPAHFVGCTIGGGRRSIVCSNFGAGRPSFVLLEDCGAVGGSVLVEGNSRLILKGSTHLTGTVKQSSGGQIVKS